MIRTCLKGLYRAATFCGSVILVLYALMIAPMVMAQVGGGGVSTRPTTNGSSTITTGNTFQTILGASFTRLSVTIQNNNATDSCRLFIGSGTATASNSMLLASGGSYQRYWPFTISDAIQMTCANNGDTFYLDTQ